MSAADAATLVAANLQLVAIYEDNSSFNYLNLSHFLLAAFFRMSTTGRLPQAATPRRSGRR